MTQNTEIYYFSGTGNSLSVAREIAARTEANLIPIASLVDEVSVKPQADVVGIVFPVYYLEPPMIVVQFAKKLEVLNGKYVFVVCTYGGGTGISLRMLKRLINSRGGVLSAAYGVQMPQNAFHKLRENRQKIYLRWEKKLALIVKITEAKGKTSPVNIWLEWIITPLHILFFKNICRKHFMKLSNLPNGLEYDEYKHAVDRSFFTNANCSGCGICSRVCPVNNIEIRDNKPVWLNHCENCLACYNWCPNKAIEGCVTHSGYFYHHPKIQVSDMLREK
jgi:ferredoxin